MMQVDSKSAERTAPAGFAQERLWIAERSWSHGNLYNSWFAVSIDGDLDIRAVALSLNAVMMRHEVLRTTFALREGQLKQIIHPPKSCPWAFLDLSSMNAKDADTAAQSLVHDEVLRPFNLESDLLLRGLVIKLAIKRFVLLLVTHHIVVDYGSLSILFRDLSTAYEAYVSGRDPDFGPEKEVQYSDFARGQRERVESGSFQQQLDYWRTQLLDCPALEIARDEQPLAETHQLTGLAERGSLPDHLTDGLKAFAREENVTLFAVLLSAYYVLLNQYSGQSDLALGTPVTSRNRRQLEGMIGPLINLMVLRVNFNKLNSFRALVRQVWQTLGNGFINQDIPFEKIVKETQPFRKYGKTPYCEAFFSLHHQNLSLPRFGSAAVEPFKAGSGQIAARFDLSLSAMVRPDAIHLVLECEKQIASHSAVKNFFRDYIQVLEFALANPDQALCHLSLLEEVERWQLLIDRNRTELPLTPKCLHQLFEEQARQTPCNLAVVADDTSINYAELLSLTGKLADDLRGRGIVRGHRVALFLEPGIDMLVSMLGVLRTGAAYIPVDPMLPAERIKFILRDTEPAAILVNHESHKHLPSSVIETIFVSLSDVRNHSAALNDMSTTCGPDDLAYIIYTSGSTGSPKGVQVTHKGVINLLLHIKNELDITARDRFLAMTTPSFDIAALELFLPLLVGAPVTIVPRSIVRNPELLLRLITASRPTVIQATPTSWRMLLDAGWKGDGQRSIKILCGGEALPPDEAQRLLECVPRVWIVYGPTETSIWSTVVALDNPDRNRIIGTPVSNTQVYVVDEWGEVVPVGVPGELWIGGVGVARGYLNRGGLTAEKFVPNRYGTAGTRLYRSGDRVRWREDGTLEFLGRIDEQVKVRGYRIELGEIEAVLNEHPGVQQSAVVAREDGTAGGGKRLVAYVVRRSEVTASELREWMKERLPEYMIAGVVVFIGELPLTANGKLNRKALPAPEMVEFESGARYVAPRTLIEEMLCGIWQQVLRVERVGVDDNFFELGGDSMLALQVTLRAQQIGLTASTQHIFDHGTVGYIASVLSGSARTPLDTIGHVTAGVS